MSYFLVVAALHTKPPEACLRNFLELRALAHSSRPLYNCTREALTKTKSSSLLLATGLLVDCLLTCDNLPQHHHTVTIHESDAREALTILEGVSHEWLLRLEAGFCHLV